MLPPSKEQLPVYYQTYYGYLTSTDVMTSLQEQAIRIDSLKHLPDTLRLFAYAPGKWTVAQLIGHLIDTERIFEYRIMRLARRDATPMEGFDENLYAENSGSDHCSIHQLIEEWLMVRKSTLLLLERLDDHSLDFIGTANNLTVSPRMIAFMTFAHAEHHLNILRERYLKSNP